MEREKNSKELRRACIDVALVLLKRQIKDKRGISKIKKEISRLYRLPKLPSDPEILFYFKEKFGENENFRKLKSILRLKPVRTISGVAVISVMSSPAPCPHGKCIPCPGGVDKGTPQSYIGLEPAAMRGAQHNYNPFDQVFARLNELYMLGHEVEKVEIIVMGGTFPARDRNYKRRFILGIFNALNAFKKERFKKERSLEKAKKKNEQAKARCVGLTIETRPDFSKEEHIIEMLKFGCTKVEIGVQSIYDEVLQLIRRGHGVAESIKATALLKDSGLKVGYHIMLGLPGSDFNMDLKMLKEIFKNENFKPDFLKIYPTLVVEGTKLYEWWKSGKYEPLTTEEVVELIARAKKHFPVWVRVQRIQRDIPVHHAIGLNKGNIRQLVHKRLKELGYSCRCIRCREIGHKIAKIKKTIDPKDFELKIRKYKASNGLEYFISFENLEYDALLGYIRLRFPSKPFIKEISNCALIRELHIYGRALALGQRDLDAYQHRGYGRRLLSIAEEIAKEKYDEIAITSGVGVREYYRKLGYTKRFEYMVKKLV